MAKLLATVTLVTAILSTCEPSLGSDQLPISESERVVSVQFPEPGESWEPVSLPQNLGEHVSEDFDLPIYVWFRFDLSKYADLVAPSVFIPRHNMTAAVFLDDEYIGGTSEGLWGQRPMGWNMPLMLDLPVTKESEFLYIQLESGPSGTLLAPIFIGPRQELLAKFESRYFIQITTSKIAFVICTLMGVLALWLWFRRKEDMLYLRFTWLCGCYSVQSAFGFLEFIPLDLRTWLFAVHVAGEWANYLLVSFVLLALGKEMPRLTKVLFYLACLATLVLLVIPDQYFLSAAYLSLGVGNVLVYGFGAWVVFRVMRPPITSDLWFGVAFIGMFFFSAHDFYGVFLSSPEEYAEGVNWMHLSLPLLAMAFYSHLLNRFVTALDTSEKLNQELQEASEDKQRIYRDLHDDVGSRLLSIIHQNEESTGKLAREALENIRSTLYSVNHSEESISKFAEDVLEEVELRLTSAGIQTDVEADLDADVVIDAEVAYHLKRILREVVNNILHHAQATFVTTHIGLRENQLELEVTDDGVGIGAEPVESSGLGNIKFRAAQIGADYVLKSMDEGTNFQLVLRV